MANHREVVTGGDGLHYIGAATVGFSDRAHVEVISENEVFVEAELATQKTVDDFWRERRWMHVIKQGKAHVAGHDCIQLGYQRGVGQDVVAQ